jgi:hypothetical protein
MLPLFDRRHMLGLTGAGLVAGLVPGAAPPVVRLATFSAEVTVPMGHALMGGGIAPAKKVLDPLFAQGFVLLGTRPVVVVTVDWCEIRNDAYFRWREVLAKAAGTTTDRVLVTCIHQHDAPVADLTAEKLLRAAGPGASVCDPEFHEKAVQRVGRALTSSLRNARRITHIGTGEAEVREVASNRRFLDPKGKVAFGRTSATRDAHARSQPEGTIDPRLKTLSFWDGEKPVAALNVYSTHPMSHYGKGGVSADFVGMARRRQQTDLPAVAVMYGSGASGNVTAGKYNDGDPANRKRLADRLYKAMGAAWANTRRRPISEIGFRSIPYRLEPRADAEFTTRALEARVKDAKRPFDRCLAAMGLSWRRRVEAGKRLDLPVLDLGVAQLLVLPGEAYVEYQLLAQKMRPDSFVVCLGYGECGTGYVPTERAVREKDSNLHDWCWVAPGAEKVLTAVIRKGLVG